MAQPNYAVQFFARTAIAGGAALGNGLVDSGSSGTYNVATSANRAGGKRSSWLVVALGHPLGDYVVQSVGDVDGTITGLAAGSVSWVRMSSTGTCERFTPSGGGTSDIIGYCEASGLLHLCMGHITENMVVGGSVSVTGTGFLHATAGSLDAASKLVDTADVNANQITDALIRQGGACSVIGRGANSTGNVADISAGSNNTVMKRAANALAFATIVDADVDAAAAIAGTKVSPNFGSQDIVTTGRATIGATPAAAGKIGLPNGTANGIKIRNSTNASDLDLANVSSGDSLFLWGTSSAYGNVETAIGSGALWRFGTTGTYVLTLSDTKAEVGVPMIGYSGQSSPYSAHGGVVSGGVDSDYTYVNADYNFDYIDETFTLTAQRNRILPNPSSKARGYYKTIRNATGQNLVVKCGAGTTTQTLATGTTKRFWVEPDKVFLAE